MNKEGVLSLAKLARIKLKDKEAEGFSHEFDTILDYVGEVKKAGTSKGKSEVREDKSPPYNVFREDAGAHKSGLYTEKILKQVPSREGDYIKVKKIL